MSKPHTEPVPLDPNQADALADRFTRDAALLRGQVVLNGYDARERTVPTGQRATAMLDGQKLQILPTFEQRQALHNEYIVKPAQAEFAQTPTGEAVKIKADELNSLKLNSGMLLTPDTKARVFDHNFTLMAKLEDDERDHPFQTVYGEFVAKNDVDVDLWEIDRAITAPDEELRTTLAAKVREEVEASEAALTATAEHLRQYTDYHIGAEVSVLRNGRDGEPAYPEHGWRVEDVLANGKLSVRKKGLGEKRCSIEFLDAVNGTPRTPVYNDLSEAIAVNVVADSD